MNFNNTKGISPTQLRGKQRGQQIQMAIASGIGGRRNEQGEEARGDRPRPSRRPGIRRLDLPDCARLLGFGPPRFNLGRKRVGKCLVNAIPKAK